MSSPAGKRTYAQRDPLNRLLHSPAAKTPKLDDGHLTLKSVLGEMKSIEERLQEHVEKVFSRLSCELNALETKLMSKFKSEINSMQERANDIEDIFRTKPRTSNNNNTLVIVKFYTPFDRNRTLKAFSDYRRRTNGVVSMRIAGFDSDNSFRLYESLSIENRKILQRAVRIKREKKLWSVFSARGQVYVRIQKNSEAICVADEEALELMIQ